MYWCNNNAGVGGVKSNTGVGEVAIGIHVYVILAQWQWFKPPLR